MLYSIFNILDFSESIIQNEKKRKEKLNVNTLKTDRRNKLLLLILFRRCCLGQYQTQCLTLLKAESSLPFLQLLRYGCFVFCFVS